MTTSVQKTQIIASEKSQEKKPRCSDKKPKSQDRDEKAKILGKKPRSGNAVKNDPIGPQCINTLPAPSGEKNCKMKLGILYNS